MKKGVDEMINVQRMENITEKMIKKRGECNAFGLEMKKLLHCKNYSRSNLQRVVDKSVGYTSEQYTQVWMRN